jgi:hypothetical protein
MTGAIKHDGEKTQYELLSEPAVEGLARVLTYGRIKYAADNWRKGMSWRRLIGAALRHLFAFMRGEDLDPESGLPHIDHAMCCLMFLSEYQKTKVGTDDRYKGQPGQKVVDEVKPDVVFPPRPCDQTQFCGRGYGHRGNCDVIPF